MEQLGHSLGRLDAESPADLAHTRLIRVLGEEVEQIVVHLLFDGAQRVRHSLLRAKYRSRGPARAGTGTFGRRVRDGPRVVRQLGPSGTGKHRACLLYTSDAA